MQTQHIDRAELNEQQIWFQLMKTSLRITIFAGHGHSEFYQIPDLAVSIKLVLILRNDRYY